MNPTDLRAFLWANAGMIAVAVLACLVCAVRW